MTEKYKILAKYIKDSSSETPDVETYLFVKENVLFLALFQNLRSFIKSIFQNLLK